MEYNIKPQENLFRKIRMLLPPHLSLVDQISETLGISSDSAYRRIRGEKILQQDEFLHLCKHYRISVDELIQSESGLICFKALSLDEKSFDFENYLQSIYSDLYSVSKQENPHLCLIFNELNLFQILQMPSIAAFKFFFWSKSHFGFQSYQERKYSVSHLTTGILKLIKDIDLLYTKIPTTELFTLEALASMLKQFAFYSDSGYLAGPDDVKQLCDDLSELLAHIKKQAELGFKFRHNTEPQGEEGNYKLYFNDLVMVDNTVIVTTGQTKVSYITCNSVNLLISDNRDFYEHNLWWARNLIGKSTLISGAAERERNKCFRIMNDQIAEVRSRIC